MPQCTPEQSDHQPPCQPGLSGATCLMQRNIAVEIRVEHHLPGRSRPARETARSDQLRAPPRLLTRMSSRPRPSTTSSTARPILLGHQTSAWTTTAPRPSTREHHTVSAAPARVVWPSTATSARPASASADRFSTGPSRRAPPVTSTTRAACPCPGDYAHPALASDRDMTLSTLARRGVVGAALQATARRGTIVK